MSDKEKQLHIRAVILLILVMTAIAMLGEVSRQNWNSKVTAYPTKTEEAIEHYARQILSEMTLEERVGQLFLVSDTSDGELTGAYHVGGVLLGDQNLENLSANEVSAVVSSFQGEAKIPLFVAVNEEGGEINTVSKFRQLRNVPFLSPSELMTTGGMTLVESDTEDKAEFLGAFGVNLNFAPVCHVVTEKDALMYPRALGRDADDTARYIETVVRNMNDKQMIGVLKHFPGYGDLTAVTEGRQLVDEREMEIFETADFLPFERGLKAGAKAVQMGHSVVTEIDSENPACLSRQMHTLLRRQFGFDGVIISDDLSGQSLRTYGTAPELAIRALKAGSDLLLTADFEQQIPAVVQAVLNGEISRERIDESVLRILKLKIEFSILI